jgi:site-specific DNA-adenine methylase
MGSKNKLAKELSPIIQSYVDKGCKGYLEPFVGGANMIDKIKCDNKYGSDNHKYLIAFLNSLSKGYEPPKNISEEEYKYIKTHQNEYSDEFLGYVGFQLSYGAKWFDTFRRDKIGKRKYDEEAYRNVMKQAPLLKNIKFKCCSFQDINNIKGFVIYCDPPYRDTASYSTGDFPYEEFYNWCREKLKRDNIQGKTKANQTHYEVGKKVRETIKELGGTMPEDLPTPKTSVSKIEKSHKSLEDKNHE